MIVDWFAEGQACVTLFVTVVISNLIARLFWKHVGVKNYVDFALITTFCAVTAEVIWLNWAGPTVTSVMFGMACAYIVHRMRSKEVPHVRPPDRPRH